MSDSKPVSWFAEDRKPNSFFFRSAFRSSSFLINAALVAVVTLVFAGVLRRYWGKLSHKSWALSLLMLFIINVVYPFFRALRRHQRVNDLYAAGYLAQQAAGTPLDEVLGVTDDAVNEAFFIPVFSFGLLLFAVVMWKLR
jgi:hypothetical protein